MNKKVNTYLLLVLTVSIWGGVLYKIFTGVNTGDQRLDNETLSTEREERYVMNDFELSLGYKDPFLGNSTIQSPLTTSRTVDPRVNDQTKGSGHKNKKQGLEKDGQHHHIIYKGEIQGYSSSVKVAVIQINGVDHLVRVGEKVGVITVVKITADRLTISDAGTIKNFEK